MVSGKTALGFLSGDVPGNFVGRHIGWSRTEHLLTAVLGFPKELGWHDV